MEEDQLMILCENCNEPFHLDEMMKFSPENESKTLRVCEVCYDKLDNNIKPPRRKRN